MLTCASDGTFWEVIILYWSQPLNYLFSSLRNIDICDFADDTTPSICDNSIDKVLTLLEINSRGALYSFENNYMKLNTDKCHLTISGYKHEQVWAQVSEDKIWESTDVKLLSYY